MSKNLEQSTKKHHVAEVVHHGDQLLIPDGMDVDDAIRMLLEHKEYQEQKVNVNRQYKRFPWDGAFALFNVLKEKYGWAQMKPTKSFFGENPPQLIDVEIAPGQFASVPWGQFSLPNISGMIRCGSNGSDFHLQATVLRKDEEEVRKLFSEVDQQLKDHSIYMGKPVRLRWSDDDDAMPNIEFVNVEDADIDKLVYSSDIEQAIQTNLFTPIQRIDDCIANGISVKRGVLLAGPYGTGKTLAAKAAARAALDAGVTFIYVDRAQDYAKAIEFAKTYSKPAAAIFCEDIDRVTSGERNEDVDAILNIMDGVDSKNFNIMTVLTTNRLDKITPAMQRPGRLDAIINVTAPDAEAAARLVKNYAGGLYDDGADYTAVGEKLAGYIPAIIAEVVKRAKLSQLALLEPGEPIEVISPEAVLDATVTIEAQAERLSTMSEEERTPNIDRSFDELVVRSVKPLTKRVEDIARHVGA